ncbi:MAG: hypothetical protein R3358_08110 [Woeseiaceae bacterium]|nr:hypothetical protein [Woeseiaceae bacterium]
MKRENYHHKRLTLCVLAVLLALAGCGKQPLIRKPQDVAWYQRVQPGSESIAIVDVSQPRFDIDIDWLGKGKSAGQGIGRKMDDWRCGDFGEAGPAAVIGLVCLVAAVPAGMVDGASNGVESDALDEEIGEIRRLLDGDSLAAALTERARAYAGSQRLSVVRDSAGEAARRRLELSLEKVQVLGTALPDFAFAVRIQGKATLYDGNRALHRFDFVHSSGVERAFAAWHADDNAALAQYVEQATQTLAGNVIDEALLVWYPTTAIERDVIPAFVLSDGNSIEQGFLFPFHGDEVSWEAFPRAWDTGSLPPGAEVSDVSYRIRFFEITPGIRQPTASDIRLVHEVGGLLEASYDPNEQLKGCRNHLWSVRAEFMLDGQPRVTEWSGVYDQQNWQFRPWKYRRGKHNVAGPEGFYYGFRTRCSA